MTTSLYTRRAGRALSATAAPTSTDGRPDWRHQALCRRTPTQDSFFPVGTTAPARAAIEQAKNICGACPVRLACAQWALTQRVEFGVWGGLDEDERRGVLHRHRDKVSEPEQILPVLERRWASSLRNAVLDAYLRRTEQEDDGHVRWACSRIKVSIRGRDWTPLRLAFFLGHNRLPESTVTVLCGRTGCVAAEHLADHWIRVARKESLGKAA